MERVKLSYKTATKQLSEATLPLKQKQKRKEEDLTKSISLSESEVQALEKALHDFQADKRSLAQLDGEIREFEESSQSNDLGLMSSKMEAIRDSASEAKNELLKLQPGLTEIRKTVTDRERHKRQLQQNIDILVAEARISVLNEEIDKLKEEKDSIEGSQSALAEHGELTAKRESLLQKKARSDGMFSSHMEQVRALHVSLNRLT